MDRQEKTIGYKWIFKRKKVVDMKVETFKARLITKRFIQKEGFDYEKTFLPVGMKDLREARYVLGIQFIRDGKYKLLVLSHALYVDKILVSYAVQNSKKGNLPSHY